MNRLDKLLVARGWRAFIFFLLSAGSLAAQTVTVSGHISPASEVTVELLGQTPNQTPLSLVALTDENGNYSFSVPTGSSFSIIPYKDDEPLNGVSTYDLVLIARHFTGEELLTSPYHLIAADIDRNGIINAADTIELHLLVLGIYQELSNNVSWRLVRADYIFPDPSDPFHPPYPETAVFNHLSANVEHIDFIAVKVGDVNSMAAEYSSGNFWGLTGTIRADTNNNCQADSAELPLNNWLVTARGTTGSFYGTTDQSGQYSIYFPTGSAGEDFDVFLSPPNALWHACTDTLFGLNLYASMVDTVDFSVQAVLDCPAMAVDLATPFLRRCFNSNYTVSYCNQGTVTAENATIEITFDPLLEVQNSTIPWTTVDGNTYTFPVGNVAPGACATFQVAVKVSCDAVLGQTHCSTAHIFPDTPCMVDPLWDGANLILSGECQGDEIVFTITNTGADMTEAVGYVVIEDIMIQMTGGSIQLGHDESETITLPANGSSWRLQVDQSAYHPGSLLVSAAVEGCGTNGQGSASLGIIPLFPTNNAGLFEDEDCQQNIGSYDPNDKQGFPVGIGAPHYIPLGQELEYMIRFQNTGTDTAFNIIILDTLSNALDPSTLRAGGSSHSYTYKILGDGVVQFVFANILLPDSSTNETASHGFCKFTIAPKADRPNGTLIENEAAIFFDFNLPVITNRTWHTLGSAFLNVSNVVFQPGLSLDVVPNPTSSTANFSLKTTQPTSGTLQLFDIHGQLLQTLDFEHNVFELPMADWPPGLYFFRLYGKDGRPLAAGKIVRAY